MISISSILKLNASQSEQCNTSCNARIRQKKFPFSKLGELIIEWNQVKCQLQLLLDLHRLCVMARFSLNIWWKMHERPERLRIFEIFIPVLEWFYLPLVREPQKTTPYTLSLRSDIDRVKWGQVFWLNKDDESLCLRNLS